MILIMVGCRVIVKNNVNKKDVRGMNTTLFK